MYASTREIYRAVPAREAHEKNVARTVVCAKNIYLETAMYSTDMRKIKSRSDHF